MSIYISGVDMPLAGKCKTITIFDNGSVVKANGSETLGKASPVMGNWISVKKQLPEKKPLGHMVLCSLKKKGVRWIGIRLFMNGKFIHPKKQKAKVTHWMPLPEPPKEEME